MMVGFFGYFWLFIKRPQLQLLFVKKNFNFYHLLLKNITITTKTEKTKQSYVVKLYSILWSRNQTPLYYPPPIPKYNVYYIIHIFCRLFFCVCFIPISTQVFFLNYHYYILQCYIFFGYFTILLLLYTFLPYKCGFFWLKDAFFHVFFSQHFFCYFTIIFFYQFFSVVWCIFFHLFLVIKMFFLESVFIYVNQNLNLWA